MVLITADMPNSLLEDSENDMKGTWISNVKYRMHTYCVALQLVPISKDLRSPRLNAR